MPFFSKKKTFNKDYSRNNYSHFDDIKGTLAYNNIQNAIPVLKFQCQLSQGSPTGLISGFTSVRELYQKIANCFSIDASEILFCTLNTHKIDMALLLAGQIGLTDFIFAHVKGSKKEIELVKLESNLGLTVTDNGTGYTFIKSVKDDSVISRAPMVFVGDHIERINSKNVVGLRHFEVASLLKELPIGEPFVLRLVEPEKSGFGMVGPVSSNKKRNFLSGKATLRFKAPGMITVQSVDDAEMNAIEGINSLLETFMGVNDNALAETIWNIGKEVDNPISFSESIASSEVNIFAFTEEQLYDLWGSISDPKMRSD